jgi:hypothetical protein
MGGALLFLRNISMEMKTPLCGAFSVHNQLILVLVLRSAVTALLTHYMSAFNVILHSTSLYAREADGIIDF